MKNLTLFCSGFVSVIMMVAMVYAIATSNHRSPGNYPEKNIAQVLEQRAQAINALR